MLLGCGKSLVDLDLSDFISVVVSYFVSNPNEYRHEVRKSILDFIENGPSEGDVGDSMDFAEFAQKNADLLDSTEW